MTVARPDPPASSLDFVSAYADAASEVVATIPSCDMGASVPACPGWSTYDLLVHLANVHAWAATVVETHRGAPNQNDEPPSHRVPAVEQWYSGKAEDLLAVLRAADPDSDCWTFSARHRTAAFWARRQTHETVVHLADLRQSAGRTPDVAPVLAADGVAEVLEVFLPRMHDRGRPADLRAPLLLHADDTGDTWLLRPPADGPPLVRRMVGDDLVDDGTDLVSAPAADLMLLLWHRLPDPANVRIDGERDRVLAFLHSPLTA